MKAKDFDNIVKARANERVQAKIDLFKQEVKNACTKLFGRSYYTHDDLARKLFSVMASTNLIEGWPSQLWETEEKKVTEELLSIMDEMQRAFLAAQKGEAGENKPEEGE